jgi:hypothetical protein
VALEELDEPLAVASVERLFLGRFDDVEREQLARLLVRLPGTEPEPFA